MMSDVPADPIPVRSLAGAAEAAASAALMSASDPWSALGFGYDVCLRRLQDPSREVYVAGASHAPAGFVILSLTGSLIGIIQTVCVAPAYRGRGLDSQLIDFAERRIFRASPNAFLCVSSFNHDARRLYQRLGYVYVGELTDYLVRGHSELLFRKTRGPWSEFVPLA
jgi:ribosomal protein S18 acetylase RimI-like enzyme